MIQKKYLTYEELWTTDLSTVKSSDKLKEALIYHFNAKVPRTRKELLESLAMEKAKREKVFTLILEIDAEEKIRIPFTIFAWEENGNVHNSTFLAQVDSFTVNFEDEIHLIEHVLKNSNKYFSKAHSDFLESCKGEIALSDLRLRVVQNMELSKTCKYDDFYEVVYSDNEYLKGFLRFRSSKKHFSPIYHTHSSYYEMNDTIEGDFTKMIERTPEFKEFSQSELQGNIWPFNKTLSSGAIKDYCDGRVINPSKIFQKYKNIRIASILMTKFEKQNIKKNSF